MDTTRKIEKAQKELADWEGKARYAMVMVERLRGRLSAYRELEAESGNGIPAPEQVVQR